MPHELDIADALLSFIIFGVSVTLHEAAHAWAALKGGDPTAYHGGQVTIDPTPHIQREPFGMVVLPLLSLFLIGWPLGFASAPYDPMWAVRHPRRAALMAAAGPAANLALLIVAALGIKAGMLAGVFHAPSSLSFGHIVGAEGKVVSGIGYVLGMGFCMNLLMFVFNLLPLPPLDGSGVVMGFLDEETAEKYLAIMHQPAFTIIGMLLAWKLIAFVYSPILLFAISLLYPESNYR